MIAGSKMTDCRTSVAKLTPTTRRCPVCSEPREMPAVLCVGVNDHHVSPIVLIDRPLAGSMMVSREKGRKGMGPWALVSDNTRDRMARALIFRAGWGVRRDGAMAEVVEWRWLHQEVTSGDVTIHNAAELHAEILGKYASDPTFCVAAGLPLPVDGRVFTFAVGESDVLDKARAAVIR